ncbi:MAG: PqqD family protein [Clostridiales bacterium]
MQKKLFIAKSIVFKNNNKIVARKIHGSFFLIDISDNYANNKCALYEINETGMFIWNHINGLCTIGELAASLQSAIIDDVDYWKLYDDVLDFIAVLSEKCFVEERCYG